MTTNLGFRQIYGIRNFGGENIAFVDNHQVVYIGGHTIVMYNKSDKRQRFIHLSEVQDNITAFTSESGKKLCAVAEGPVERRNHYVRKMLIVKNLYQ